MCALTFCVVDLLFGLSDTVIVGLLLGFIAVTNPRIVTFALHSAVNAALNLRQPKLVDGKILLVAIVNLVLTQPLHHR